MAQPVKLSQCPGCAGPMHVSGKECRDCGIEVRGRFDENPLTLLSRDEQDFVLQFVLVAGNFKALGERLDLSYPTLRSRLDRILAKLETLRAPPPPTADGILDAVDQGEVGPDDALRLLRQLGKKGSSR